MPKVCLLKIWSDDYSDDDYARKSATVNAVLNWEEVSQEKYRELVDAVNFMNRQLRPMPYTNERLVIICHDENQSELIAKTINEYLELTKEARLKDEAAKKRCEADKKRREAKAEEKKRARELKKLEELKKKYGNK